MNNDKGDKDMEATAKKGYRSLSLSPRKLKEISVKPTVRNGKALFDRNNDSHRYIMDERNRY